MTEQIKDVYEDGGWYEEQLHICPQCGLYDCTYHQWNIRIDPETAREIDITERR